MLYIAERSDVSDRYVNKDAIPKTALVVDDSMLIRHSVCRFLEERGFIVEAATNGVEALECLE